MVEGEGTWPQDAFEYTIFAPASDEEVGLMVTFKNFLESAEKGEFIANLEWTDDGVGGEPPF